MVWRIPKVALDVTTEAKQTSDHTRNHARVNRTVAALMRRGFDSDLANRIKQFGLTLTDLKQRDDEALSGLGLSATDIAAVREGDRPPVPFDTLVQVLWENRSACCVCRAFDRAIVLHHIVPWAKSHDHSTANLAVLCLEHHAQAHRRGALEQNLGAAQLRAYKQKWEDEVRHLDPKVVLDATRVDAHHWWWFNHVRVLEMARRLEIDLTNQGCFPSIASRGWVDAEGQISERHLHAPYMYMGGDGILLYEYMRDVVEAVFARTSIFSLSDDLDPGFLSRVVQPGDLILVQGQHTFKSLSRERSGPGQACAVHLQTGRVQVSFTIDRWEAVSNSSWAAWLFGVKHAASVVRIAHIEREDNHLHLQCTGMAVGSALQGLSTRHYYSTTWSEREAGVRPCRPSSLRGVEQES